MRAFIVVIFLCTSLIAQESYRFGVFPHMPAENLYRVFSEVTKDLEAYIGHPVVLTTKPYFELYKEELEKGSYDIAFIQPFDYVGARMKQGYIPIANRAEKLTSILVVTNASAFSRIDQLKNRVIASAPASAAVTQMMIRSLERRGYDLENDFTLSYSKNHFVCLQKVIDGKAAACITAERAREQYAYEKGGENFRTLYESEALPHALFVVHPRVPEKIRRLLQERIIQWSDDEKGRLILARGNLLSFKKTDDQEYQAIQEFLQK